MKILIAPNAFKESLTAAEAARAIRRGLARALPGAELVELPVADGGDGTAEALRRCAGGRTRRYRFTGPLGAKVSAPIARLAGQDAPTDVIEMADIAGLRLVAAARRNPMKTSTEGLGEAIARSVERGARRLILGIGGSATVDGGSGMARALGFKLLDARGRPIARGGGGLEKLARIEAPADGAWGGERASGGLQIVVACDVKNRLLGARGAAAVFGPQKGATPAMVGRLDAGLARLAERWEADLGVQVRGLTGGGAAGGLGAGLVAFLGAELRPGADLVLDTIGFDRAARGADFVVTGEGRIDGQTLEDKAPAVVARRASALGAPAIVIAGSIAPELARPRIGGAANPFAGCFSLAPGPIALEEAQAGAAGLLERAAFQVGSLLAASRPPGRRPHRAAKR